MPADAFSWFNGVGVGVGSAFSGKETTHLPAEDLEFHRLLRRGAEPGILVFGVSGDLISWNDTAQRLLQADLESTSAQGPDGLPEPLAACLRRAQSPSVRAFEETLTLESRDGQEPRRLLWVNVFSPGEERADGSGTVVTLHDLDVARQLEAQTTRLQQLANVGMLSAGVAHEVKNALVAVKTYAELLLEKQPDSESADLVRREVSRIDSLIGQLLQLASPASGEPSSVQMHEVLRHALRLVQHSARERQVTERVLLEASVDRVSGDAKQLGQAFLNLLFNALEALEPGGQLVVRTEVVVATEHVSKFEPGRREQQLQVEIRDTGTGMSPEVLERLFTPFVTTKPRGTGLGLAITRRIITEHRGRITVETKLGQGTTFRVLLPLFKES